MKAGKCRTDAEVLLRSSFFLFSSNKALQMGHKVADELQRLHIISYKIKNNIANDKLKKKKATIREGVFASLLGAFFEIQQCLSFSSHNKVNQISPSPLQQVWVLIILDGNKINHSDFVWQTPCLGQHSRKITDFGLSSVFGLKQLEHELFCIWWFGTVVKKFPWDWSVSNALCVCAGTSPSCLNACLCLLSVAEERGVIKTWQHPFSAVQNWCSESVSRGSWLSSVAHPLSGRSFSFCWLTGLLFFLNYRQSALHTYNQNNKKKNLPELL